MFVTQVKYDLMSDSDRALILFIQTLALYKSFTYLLTYLHECIGVFVTQVKYDLTSDRCVCYTGEI